MKPKLNGWIRLWIVLSAIWLLFVGVRAYADLSPLIERKTYRVSKEGIGTAHFVFSKSDPEEFVHQYIAEELIPMIEKEPSTYVGKTITSNYDGTLKRELAPKVVQYLKEAFLPVLGVIFIGWAFVWVKRGFESQDKFNSARSAESTSQPPESGRPAAPENSK